VNLPKPLYELKPYILIVLGIVGAFANSALWAQLFSGLAIFCGVAIWFARDYKRMRRKPKQYSRDFKKNG